MKEENGEDDGNGWEDGTEERGDEWSFVSFSLEKEVEESPGLFLFSPRRGKDESGSHRESKKENGGEGDGGHRGADDEEETNTTQSIVSFSSENVTKEPWPPLLLCLLEVMLDLNLY